MSDELIRAELRHVLNLPYDLSEMFAGVLDAAFPGELSPLDMLIVTGEIRRAIHDATMNALHRLEAQKDAGRAAIKAKGV